MDDNAQDATIQTNDAPETQDVYSDDGVYETVVTPAGNDDKRTALIYFIFAAITLAGIYVVQLFRLTEPLFQYVYRGNMSMVFFYGLCVVFWVPFIILLNKFVKKYTGSNLFAHADTPISLKRTMIIYACAVIPIFIISACLGFTLKIVYELGSRVSQMQIITNATMYANGAVKLILAVIFLQLTHKACELLYRGKFANVIPWGGIVLALTYGPLELAVAYITGSGILFAWLGIAFALLYGIIYLLGKKSFFITYFVSLIIYIL